ncbi:hypothetical protein EDB19DRAFT_556829 [Suillus lakei]|nr:hypothetical protein EDB19DRAFT_556829 [Suillus lakei]
MVIGQCMIHEYVKVGKLIYEFESISNDNQLTDDEWSAAYSLVNIAFAPQIFDAESMVVHPPKMSRKEFTWVREDIVVCFATHLDDERCLQASVSRLIESILEHRDAPGDYFGVAFSVSHCAIVKVVKGSDALQQSPHLRRASPLSLVLVIALTPHSLCVSCRFGVGTRKRICDTLITKNHSLRGLSTHRPASAVQLLPLELWQEIALHLDLQDVLTLGLVSKLCRGLVSMVLRYPHVRSYRLVAVSNNPPKDPPQNSRILHSASFYATRAGTPATVFLGEQERTWGVVSLLLHTKRYESYLHISVSGTVQPDPAWDVWKGYHY